MPDALRSILPFKLTLPVLMLALFWIWETRRPFFGRRTKRWRHALRNLAVAVFNTVVLSLVFAAVTVFLAEWTTRNNYGALNALHLIPPVRFALAILLLDAWMYVWHRANHAVPLLWRFHRMHHSDNRMDVTTATRFHLGEHVAASVLRLGLIPLLGVSVWQLIVYDMLVVAVTQFHHANISLGRWDRWIRAFVVTPDMHKVHHSRWKPETDSNYSVLFSVWDRLARSFRLRPDPRTLQFGLDDFDADEWQTFWGMLRTPFRGRPEFDDPDANSTASSATTTNR